MLNLKIVIKYYLFLFLLVDSISGFVRVYLGISNPIFNIGYWVRGPILILFIFYYIYQIREKKIFLDEILTIVLFIYFIINMFLNYVESPSSRMISENILYIFRFQFLLFLFVFIRNRMHIDESLTRKIIYINFIVFTLNLFFGYVFGLGLEAYRFSDTTKGMFQGGNPVSILNLVFFTYFILDNKFRKQIIPIAITLFNGFAIASKSIFGFIIPIFFALKRKALSVNKLIFYTSFVFLLIFSFTTLIDKTIESYESRFGINIQKSINAAEKVGGLYQTKILNNIASINFRRYASLNEQMRTSFLDIKTLLIGASLAGQNIFWEERGEWGFKNASMDFFDFFFKFGLIGTVIFIFLLFNQLMAQFIKLAIRDRMVLILFFAYSFFGGHVIDSVTSGSLFYFFIAKAKL